MANQFGERIKHLREQNKLLQRQVASLLEIDTPLLSRIERGERIAQKKVVLKLSRILKTDKDELLILWLADQIYNIAKDENIALKAMQVAEDEIKVKSKLLEKK